MKKRFLVFAVLSCICFCIHASETITIDNPYATAVKAGMLPQKSSRQKEKLLSDVVKQVKSITPYLSLIESYYTSNKLEKIVALLKTKPELKNLIIEHPRTGLIVLKTYIKLKNNKTATELLEKLNKKHPMDQEIAFIAAQFHEKNADNFSRKKQTTEMKKEIEKGLSIINNYLNKSVKKMSNFAFLFLRSRLHLKLDEKEKALKDIQDALAMQPYFDMGWFIFAQLKEKSGELKDAIKGYSNYLDLVSSRPRNLAGQILFKTIETKLMKLIFSQVIQKYPNIERNQIEKYKSHVIKLFHEKKYKNALQELEKCINKPECDNEAKLLKVQLLGAMKKFKEAAKVVQQELMKNPTDSLWFETLHLLYHTGLDSVDAISILQTVEKKHPKNMLTLLYLADMFTRTSQTEKAIAYHNKALPLISDAHIKTSVIYQLGILYYETKQFEKMETVLQKGKNLGLDYAPLLNLLAYHYSSEKSKIDQAEKLMAIVLEKYPDNPHFLDTQARILYKQKKYCQALTILQTASKKERNDPTIVKHLAKTYEKLGKKRQAVAYMEHAAKLTYNKKKKNKYLKLAHQWKHSREKKNHLLCCR